MSVEQTAAIVKQQKVTCDLFLGEKLTISQPKSGFRAGLDSVLLGASVNSATSRILDLGSGVGVAALSALALLPAAEAMLAEIEPEMVALANQNIAANSFASRARAVACDVAGSGSERELAGLVPDHFTSTIANPPYFEGGSGTLPGDSARAGARHMPKTILDRWVRTATGCTAPKGEVIFIHRIEALPALLAAFDARLGAITVQPFSPRPGELVSRVLVRGIKGSRASLTMQAPIVLHGDSAHDFTPDVKAILMGAARLHW